MAEPISARIGTCVTIVDDTDSYPPIKREKLCENDTGMHDEVMQIVNNGLDRLTRNKGDKHQAKFSGWCSGSASTTGRSALDSAAWEASRDEIEAWVSENLEAREKSKIPSEELRHKCALALGRSFSSRRFGEAIRATLPNARLNNKGRAHPDQPLVSYYYGVAYKIPPQISHHEVESSYTQIKDDADGPCSSTSLDNPDTVCLLPDTVMPLVNQTQVTQNIDCLSRCAGCDLRVVEIQHLRKEVSELKDLLEGCQQEKEDMESTLLEKESQLKAVQEQYSEIMKKIDIVQRVLSI